MWWGTSDDGDASTDEFFFLFIEAPLAAKNMVWGSGFTQAEADLYNVHFSSHHDPLNPGELTYDKATGSEKAIFGGITADLGDSGGADAGGILDWKDSSDYLLLNGCDTTNCSASGSTMSFEFKITLDTTANDALIASILNDGIEFHLSPERGGTGSSVPEPTTLALMGLGLFGLGFNRRTRLQ